MITTILVVHWKRGLLVYIQINFINKRK